MHPNHQSATSERHIRLSAAVAAALLITACGAGVTLTASSSAVPSAATPSLVASPFGTPLSSLGPSTTAPVRASPSVIASPSPSVVASPSPTVAASLMPEPSASPSPSASATPGSTTFGALSAELVGPADLPGSVTGVPPADPVLCPDHGAYLAGTGERASGEVYQTNAPATDIVEDVYLFPDMASAGSYNTAVMAAARACGPTATLKTAFLTLNYTLTYQATTIGSSTGLRVDALVNGSDHGKAVHFVMQSDWLQDANVVLQLQYTADAPVDQASVDALLTGLVERVGA